MWPTVLFRGAAVVELPVAIRWRRCPSVLKLSVALVALCALVWLISPTPLAQVDRGVVGFGLDDGEDARSWISMR